VNHLWLLLLVGAPALAQVPRARPHAIPTQTIFAAERAGDVTLDGRLDEAAWSVALPATQFTQVIPDEGKPATQRTEVRVLFDNTFIYFGARLFDSLGSAGVTARHVRRDDVKDGETDYLMIILDTFHDHLGRMQLFVTPLGGKRDARGFGGETPDESWDPVWDVATQIDSMGWSAEVRVPLAQLRMPRDPEQVWGVNFIRSTARKNERDFFAFWRRNEAGGASRFAHLEGLRFPARRPVLDLVPFVAMQSARPLGDVHGSAVAASSRARLGADFRMPLTPNFTLTGTVLPDFGQVEVDPAIVNLSAFEPFLPEKRPFFVQDGTLFGTGDFPCLTCESVAPPALFFSRRIGRAPLAIATARQRYEIASAPDAASIPAAVKLTGRTGGGLSLGAIVSATSAVTGTGSTTAGTQELTLEPSAQFLVARLRQDLVDGNVTLGGTVTTSHRADAPVDFSALFTSNATVGSADWSVAWREKEYTWFGMLVGSRVNGAADAIRRVQTSSALYFQRPDRQSYRDGIFDTRYDTLATQLNGFAGLTRLAKGAGDWVGEVITSVISPGFEINDLGFQTRADMIDAVANAGWNNTSIRQFHREIHVVAGVQGRKNFDGDVLLRSFHSQVNVVLRNYLGITLSRINHAEASDDALTRGGPVAHVPASAASGIDLMTDRRHRTVLQVGLRHTSLGMGGASRAAVATVSWRPRPNFTASMTPSFTALDHGQQFVTAGKDSTARAWYGSRYLFGDLHQRTAALTTRFSVIPTSRLSLEAFSQILLSAGRYDAYFELEQPRSTARRYFVRGVDIAPDETTGPRRWIVDADGSTGDAAQSISFPDPTFTTRAMRTNVVLRWEFRPGSVLTTVWQQNRNGGDDRGILDGSRDLARAFIAPGTNVFAVKVSYWYPL
jgi:hypothetical protein